MTIHLPESLESRIVAAVDSGRYASLNDAMAEAASLLVQRLTQEQAHTSHDAAVSKPIWEEIQELTAGVPDEVWDKLPTDLSEQHDHYIYGTPKRPTP